MVTILKICLNINVFYKIDKQVLGIGMVFFKQSLKKWGLER